MHEQMVTAWVGRMEGPHGECRSPEEGMVMVWGHQGLGGGYKGGCVRWREQYA